jgi:hypothetical protein
MDYGIYASHLRTVTGYPLGTGNNQKVRIMYDVDRRRSSLIHWQPSGFDNHKDREISRRRPQIALS